MMGQMKTQMKTPMMGQMTLENCLAPAKLNLFLHVVGRRPDGYHLLQSAFQLLDYGDTLHFSLRADPQIVLASPVPGVPDADNLVLRAARLLQQHALQQQGHLPPGVTIVLEKRLPMGGGLGGGSSDAATTLMALNHLWQLGLPRAQLMTLGLQLGADVPFFLFGSNAFAEGIGEQLQPISTPESWYVVLEPGVMVPTPAIFSAKDLTRDSERVTIADFSSSDTTQFGKNDLQSVAARLYPQVAEALDWMASRHPQQQARMTGSGACVFCAFDDEAQARQMVQAVPKKWRAWCAKGLQQHPMAKFLPQC
jgi:4-diphosphocytidyl-2-C-methyl-D-erythritol kinase